MIVLVMLGALAFANCQTSKATTKSIGSQEVVIYSENSVSLFTSQSTIPECIKGVEKNGGKKVLYVNGLSNDGIFGLIASASMSKACEAGALK